MSRLASKADLAALVTSALANNDAALRLLAEGPFNADTEHDGSLWRACRWHVSNGDAEWLEDGVTCRITEQGRRTLERQAWAEANPEEAERRRNETVKAWAGR